MLWMLQKCWYRIFQVLLSFAECLMPWRKPKLLQGCGVIKKLPQLIRSEGIERVLIVTGGTISRLGLLDSLYQSCRDAGLSYTLFNSVEANPSLETVERGRAQYLENQCQAIIAFGGGSPMDCAKAIGARIARPKKTVAQMAGTLRVLKRIPPLYAVPTTSGTGSETTIAAVITDRETHHKFAINDLCLMPRYAVLDPELTVGMPPNTTATTGMDALTHAVESYTNRFAPRFTRQFALKAVELIFANLEAAYRDGTDLAARENMQRASFYAGVAFTRTGVGNVHAIAHTLGGLYGTPHGLANAVLLPVVLQEYGSAVHKPLARLAEAVHLEGATDAEKAAAFLARICRMNQQMQIVDRFDFIEDADIPQMVAWATREANPLYPVPVIWGTKEFTAAISHCRA